MPTMMPAAVTRITVVLLDGNRSDRGYGHGYCVLIVAVMVFVSRMVRGGGLVWRGGWRGWLRLADDLRHARRGRMGNAKRSCCARRDERRCMRGGHERMMQLLPQHES